MKPTRRLENWYWDPIYPVIWGIIFDGTKERFSDGTLIHTSYIDDSPKLRLSVKEDSIVSTLNSHYLLGKPKN